MSRLEEERFTLLFVIIKDMDKIMIFDTTLRDGEQSPGVAFTIHEKLEIARALGELRVSVIEAGFPVASAGEEEAVSRISKEIRGPVICALARAEEGDIKTAARAIKEAERSRIHVFVSTSEIHLRHQLRAGEDEVLQLARRSVRQAVSLADEVEFSPMDATRSDQEFMLRVCSAALEEGARVLNIPDTVGYAKPDEYKDLMSSVRSLGEDFVLSAHTHNDLGLAVANSIAAIEAGARQVECSVNGIGERTGNCALEEIVMLLRTRYQEYETGVRTQELARVSRLVARSSGYPVQANKPIVGKNAFSHESGIHQDGVLKERSTYEIMNPDDIGIKPDRLVLGKHSGRHAFRDAFEKLGLQPTEEEISRAFRRFKELADRKEKVDDLDLEALLHDTVSEEGYGLVFLSASTGTSAVPKAEVIVSLPSGEESWGEANGDGEIDAVLSAIRSATGENFSVDDFSVGSVSEGADAMGQVSLRLRKGDKEAMGRAAGPDVVRSAAEATLRALWRLR